MDILIGIGRMLVYSNIAFFAIAWVVLALASFLFLVYINVSSPDKPALVQQMTVYLIFEFIAWTFVLFTIFIIIINTADLKSMALVRMRDLNFGAWQSVCLLAALLSLIRSIRKYMRIA